LEIFPFSGLLVTLTLGMTLLIKYPVLAERLVKKYEKIWVFSETLLFVLVGAAVNITFVPTIGLQALTLIVGMLGFRSIGVFASTHTRRLNLKERLFVTFAYIPKATVQGSIASIPLALGISNGQTMLIVAVIAILFTALLGAFLIKGTKKIFCSLRLQKYKTN
jgi:solute carrier family 9B (sodium/hydrogen exchanger), member 1/2